MKTFVLLIGLGIGCSNGSSGMEGEAEAEAEAEAEGDGAPCQQVSAGGLHTCGLQTDGTIACWGDDSEGQSSPPLGTFTQVSAFFLKASCRPTLRRGFVTRLNRSSEANTWCRDS